LTFDAPANGMATLPAQTLFCVTKYLIHVNGKISHRVAEPRSPWRDHIMCISLNMGMIQLHEVLNLGYGVKTPCTNCEKTSSPMGRYLNNFLSLISSSSDPQPKRVSKKVSEHTYIPVVPMERWSRSHLAIRLRLRVGGKIDTCFRRSDGGRQI
jgi:hypothetical protein